MITVTYRHGRDELYTATVPAVPDVGDEVIIPDHALPVWVVTGRRWHTPDRHHGPGALHVEVWLTPC